MISLNFIQKILTTSKFTCVFLHDFLCSSVSFAPLSPFLQHSTFYVDLRNHGFSPRASLMSYSLLSLDLKEFLKHSIPNKSNAQSLVLIGHGLGGKVIMNLLNDENPELFDRIKAMVVIDVAPIDYMKERKFSWPAELFFLLEDLKAIKLHSTSLEKIKAGIMKISPNKQLLQLIMQNVIQEEDDSRNYRFKFGLSSIQENFRGLMNFPKHQKRGFDGSRLIVLGDRSEYVRDEVFPSFENIFNGFDLRKDIKYVKNAGHYIQLDQPKELMNIINEFISKI